jgi:hypothetical protein
MNEFRDATFLQALRTLKPIDVMPEKRLDVEMQEKSHDVRVYKCSVKSNKCLLLFIVKLRLS